MPANNIQRTDLNNKWILPVAALSESFIFADDTIQNSIESNELDGDDENHKTIQLHKRQGFRIGGLNFMLRYEEGSEFNELPKIYPIPNAPLWFNGFCDLHGMMIPVFDLKSYFHTEKKSSKESSKRPMLLVIEHQENATGIVVDGLLKRLEFTKENVQSHAIIPSQIASSVLDCYLLEDEIWFDLNVMAFLEDIEKSVMGKAS